MCGVQGDATNSDNGPDSSDATEDAVESEESSPEGDTSGTADSGEESSSDSFDEGDGSSDAADENTSEESEDTETNTGSETIDPDSTDCTIDLRAEVRDESGSCSSCNSGDYITVVGVIENSCTQALTYRSEKDCLVSNFDVYNTLAGSTAQYPMTCPDEILLESLEPGNSVTQTRPAGRLSAGSYELTVQFEDEERTSRTLSFTVE